MDKNDWNHEEKKENILENSNKTAFFKCVLS